MQTHSYHTQRTSERTDPARRYYRDQVERGENDQRTSIDCDRIGLEVGRPPHTAIGGNDRASPRVGFVTVGEHWRQEQLEARPAQQLCRHVARDVSSFELVPSLRDALVPIGRLVDQ